MRRSVAPLALFVLVGSACAHVSYRADYESRSRHEPLPLRASVTVLVDSALRKDWDDDDPRLEELRESLSDALKKDLAANGPLTPDATDPEARLEVTIRHAKDSDRMYYVMMWFFAPAWLFGVPYHGLAIELEVDARLDASTGGTLFQTKATASCSKLEGLYYGRENLTFGCAAKEVGEQIREKLSLRRSDVLAALFRARSATPGPSPTEDASGTLGSRGGGGPGSGSLARPVTAVFSIRDMSGRFDPLTMEQLTEYLSVQVTERLGFRVVPREQIRGALSEAKKESFKTCYDDSCQIELGKAVSANKSLSTTLIKVGNRCVFNATVYDLLTEAAERGATAETECDENALLDGVRRVVGQLAVK